MHTTRKKVLTVSDDYKTVKGEELGFLTGVLYLAPARQNDQKIQLCPMSTIAGCAAACLYSAGRGKQRGTQQARINRTNWLLEDKKSFMEQLIKDIRALIRKAKREGKTPLVRLNGTSDIRWERTRVEDGPVKAANIMALFPDVQFYDYTKIPNRTGPANYDLTFSYSGATERFKEISEEQIEEGARVAVVFRGRKTADLPKTFKGIPVVDGDHSDVRPLDGPGIIGLCSKGYAFQDDTGFVVDAK